MEKLICAVFLIFLLIIAAVDFKTKMIYDKILLPMMLAGIFFDVKGWLVPIDEGILNAALGFLIMWIIFKISHGGMGGGDVKFSAVLGLWLGDKLFSAILIASILAAIVGIIIFLRTRNAKFELPFGPFLGIGALIKFLW